MAAQNPARRSERRFNRKAANRERRASASTLVAHPGAATINGKRRATDGASSAEEGEVSDAGESNYGSQASSSVSKLARNGPELRHSLGARSPRAPRQ